MRLGLMADIHEHVDNLRWALTKLRECHVDRIIVLGDIFETGKNIDATLDLLGGLPHDCIFGNHDLGFCVQPEPKIIAKYSSKVMEYFSSCQPFIELNDMRFTHGMPNWDPLDPTIYYIGEPVWEPAAREMAFSTFSDRLFFMGHFHRWSIYDTQGQIEWDRRQGIALDPSRRYMVVIRPVADAACAIFDTDTGVLTPYLRP